MSGIITVIGDVYVSEERYQLSTEDKDIRVKIGRKENGTVEIDYSITTKYLDPKVYWPYEKRYFLKTNEDYDSIDVSGYSDTTVYPLLTKTLREFGFWRSDANAATIYYRNIEDGKKDDFDLLIEEFLKKVKALES